MVALLHSHVVNMHNDASAVSRHHCDHLIDAGRGKNDRCRRFVHAPHQHSGVDVHTSALATRPYCKDAIAESRSGHLDPDQKMAQRSGGYVLAAAR